jgi:hypothetical protein
MFRKAQWNELYYTHSKSQWVERFVHRLKTSFWLRSSNHMDSCHVDSCYWSESLWRRVLGALGSDGRDGSYGGANEG